MVPMIEFKDFTFQYWEQKEPALRNINLTIHPGERILVTGASGSGKSTLACCINGLVPFLFAGKSSGTVAVMGENPAKAGVLKMSGIVRTVLQDVDSQFVGRTVAEDIAFILENEGMPQEEMAFRVKKMAEAVDVEPFLERVPAELSRGQRQRAAMAGALAEEAEVFLFDSPLSGLDPEARKRITGLIGDISRKKNSTVIIIEQHVEDVLYLGVDRMIIMEGGRIAAEGRPELLLNGSCGKNYGFCPPFCTVPFCQGNGEAAEGRYSEKRETMRHPPCGERAGQTALSVKNLYFSYEEGEPVLQHIHFDVGKGEMVSLIGKNGGGKSLIAEIICGFRQPSRGSVTFRGEDILNKTVRERGERIGLVTQSPAQMLSRRTVYGEVAAGLMARGMPKKEAEERIGLMLEICGLHPFAGQKISSLSFGQKKRVMIASVLIRNPEVIILDDPAAGLDSRHCVQIMEYLHKIRKKYGTAVVLITQDMHLALEHSDRAIVVSDGHLLADGATAKVLADEVIVRKACLACSRERQGSGREEGGGRERTAR